MSRDSVLIVGAGPVGLLNALGLARAGIPVVLIERESGIVSSPRAVVYHWSVLEGLERLGILEDARAIGFTKQDYQYRVFRTGETISWTLAALADYGPYAYNLHLGQDRLAQIALTHLLRFPDASILFDTRLTNLHQDRSGVTVQADTSDGPLELRASWVIGADGAGSSVRHALGLAFEGITWPHRFVATNIQYDFERYGYARSTLMIDPQYGAIIVKIDNTGLWRCTYCEDAGLPEEQVLERLPQYFEATLPGRKEYQLAQYSPYRMHQRAATQFRVGRVILAGDAAHVTNPAGGFGLTSGMFDTFVLYEALAAVILGQARDEVLDRYASVRRRVFLELVSPQATQTKRLIYHSHDTNRLEQDLRQLRRLQTDRDFLLERLLWIRQLQTPSLLDPTPDR